VAAHSLVVKRRRWWRAAQHRRDECFAGAAPCVVSYLHHRSEADRQGLFDQGLTSL